MYPIGYVDDVETQILEKARHLAGKSQDELAELAGTSRTTISAYERGRKSPTLTTVARILESIGFELALDEHVTFHTIDLGSGRIAHVADRLWRLPIGKAFADVDLALHLAWSGPTGTLSLRDPHQRARCYEIVLREGTPADIQRYVDGALLVECWSQLVLPRPLRAAWQRVIDSALQ